MYLLGFSPFDVETSFDAKAHQNHIINLLDWFTIPVTDLVCLIGDNCSTNKKTADLFGVPLMGCRSHRFNLAVEKYIDAHLADEVAVVMKLMTMLSTSKNAGKLREVTTLKPVRRNKTLWLGTIKMFQCMAELDQKIRDSDMCVEVMQSMPTYVHNSNIQRQMKNLLEFEKVTIALQSRETTVSMAQCFLDHLSDVVTSDIFDFKPLLHVDASIVHDTTFEKAIIKIQERKEGELTVSEVRSVACLLKQPTATTDDVPGEEITEPVSLSVVEMAYNRLNHINQDTTAYIDTKFILPTSNEVERLFSSTKRLFSPKRRRMCPETLEVLAFLKQNRALWDVSAVASVKGKLFCPTLLQQIPNEEDNVNGDADENGDSD